MMQNFKKLPIDSFDSRGLLFSAENNLHAIDHARASQFLRGIGAVRHSTALTFYLNCSCYVLVFLTIFCHDNQITDDIYNPLSQALPVVNNDNDKEKHNA